MKINNKILVSALAIAMGATLAGSISGTVAWFQYSTRVQGAYVGASAHCSEMLEVKVGSSAWLTDLPSSTMNSNKVEDSGTDMIPISTGALAKNAALPANFYKNPIYQITDSSKWGNATIANYVQFNMSFHVKDVDGANSASYLAKNLYLIDLTVVSSNGADLTKAVRVHFATSTGNKLFANDGTTAEEVTTATNGTLDLNNNGVLDKAPGYEWDSRGDAITYGAGSQVAYNASGTDILADDSDPNNVVANQGLIGAIPGNEAGLSVTVTIWLEGWTQLATKPEGNATTGSAVWDAATYVNKEFKVGMRFGTDAHTAH